MVDLCCLDHPIDWPQTPISCSNECTSLLLLRVRYSCIIHLLLLLLPAVASLMVVTQGYQRPFYVLGTIYLEYNRVGLECMTSLLCGQYHRPTPITSPTTVDCLGSQYHSLLSRMLLLVLVRVRVVVSIG